MMNEQAGGRLTARRPLLVLGALFAIFGLLASIAGAEAEAKKRGKNVKVMTRNVYLGADLSPALRADSLAEAVDGAGVIYNEVQRTDFPARAKPLAREIRNARPQLVGLQEVALWREQTPSDLGAPPINPGGAPAEEVTFDFLELLMDELNKKAATAGKKAPRYKVVGVQEEFEGELPADTDGSDATGTLFGADLDARLTMRDVILAKKGVKTKRLRMAHFENRFVAEVGGVQLPADRGWLSVNAKVGKAKFRFVNTHLEAFGDPEIREAQAKELFAKPDAKGRASTARKGPLRTNKQVILVGDINSGLKDPHEIEGKDQLAFKALRRFGMADRGAVQSCCYPSALDDPSFIFDHTVDHVLVKPKLKGLKSFVTGNDASQMTPSGLWPSDHGGVVSKLRLTNIRFK